MIRLRDGIHIEADRTIVADSRSAVGDVNFVTHAHADHTFRRTPETVLCSAETAALVRARTGAEFEFTESVPDIELLPAGHVVGSRAALIDADRRYLYTGDFSTRNRSRRVIFRATKSSCSRRTSPGPTGYGISPSGSTG